MRNAGKLAAKCLDYITDFIKPGISTEEINKICHEFQIENNGVSSLLYNFKFTKLSTISTKSHKKIVILFSRASINSV